MGNPFFEITFVVFFLFVIYYLYRNNHINKVLRIGLIIFTSILFVSFLFNSCDKNIKLGYIPTKSRATRQKISSNHIQQNDSAASLLKDLQILTKDNNQNFKYYLQDDQIVVIIKNIYVDPPVTEISKNLVLKNTFNRINKIQKKHKTTYPILFKDNNEIIGYSSFNGYGWYKDLNTIAKTKKSYNFTGN